MEVSTGAVAVGADGSGEIGGWLDAEPVSVGTVVVVTGAAVGTVVVVTGAAGGAVVVVTGAAGGAVVVVTGAAGGAAVLEVVVAVSVVVVDVVSEATEVVDCPPELMVDASAAAVDVLEVDESALVVDAAVLLDASPVVVVAAALAEVIPGSCGDSVVLALAMVPADTAAAAATPATSATALRRTWRAGEAPGDVRRSQGEVTCRRGSGNATAAC